MLYNLTLLKKKKHSTQIHWTSIRNVSNAKELAITHLTPGAPTGCSANAPGVAELINLEVNLTVERRGRGDQGTKVSKSVFASKLSTGSFRMENNSIATTE